MSAPLTRTQRLAAVLLEAKARHVFVNGDIAQIVVDWSIDGTGPDGERVHVEGARPRRGWTLRSFGRSYVHPIFC